MNEEKIQQLKGALKELMAMIVQRGQPLSPELKDMLFQVMQHVASRIEELRTSEEVPPAAAPAALRIEDPRTSEEVPPAAVPAALRIEELKDMLFQVMQHVASRIEELRAEGEAPITTAAAASQIEPSGPSSNVEGFAYDPKSKRLLVRFLGKHPNRNGPIYGYDKVPPEIFDLLRKGAVPARSDGKNKWGKWWKGKVPSFGASVFTLIKNGGYNYRRMA